MRSQSPRPWPAVLAGSGPAARQQRQQVTAAAAAQRSRPDPRGIGSRCPAGRRDPARGAAVPGVPGAGLRRVVHRRPGWAAVRPAEAVRTPSPRSRRPGKEVRARLARRRHGVPGQRHRTGRGDSAPAGAHPAGRGGLRRRPRAAHRAAGPSRRERGPGHPGRSGRRPLPGGAVPALLGVPDRPGAAAPAPRGHSRHRADARRGARLAQGHPGTRLHAGRDHRARLPAVAEQPR